MTNPKFLESSIFFKFILNIWKSNWKFLKISPDSSFLLSFDNQCCLLYLYQQPIRLRSLLCRTVEEKLESKGFSWIALFARSKQILFVPLMKDTVEKRKPRDNWVFLLNYYSCFTSFLFQKEMFFYFLAFNPEIVLLCTRSFHLLGFLFSNNLVTASYTIYTST